MRGLQFVFLSIVAAGCSRPALNFEQAAQNFEAQVKEAGKATVEENHERLVDLTLPELIQRAGGRAEYIKVISQMASEMKQHGTKLTKMHVSGSAAIVQKAGRVFGTLPYSLETTGPGGASGSIQTFMIGVSSDGGHTWKFMDGLGTKKGGRSRVKSLLPDFPDELPLPEVKGPDIKFN